MEFKELLNTWDKWYQAKTGLRYNYAPRDFNNFKLLLRKLELNSVTLENYLGQISDPWYLENASIPLFNSHFNQLMNKAANQESQRFPNHYDTKFERELKGQEIIDYHKHLKKLGYEKLYSPGAGTAWRKMV